MLRRGVLECVHLMPARVKGSLCGVPATHTACVIQSSEAAAVQIGPFADVGPIHDRRAELLIACVDFFGKLVARADLGDNILAELKKRLQQGVVEFQDFDAAFIAQLA